jgi:hypothetical protein
MSFCIVKFMIMGHMAWSSAILTTLRWPIVRFMIMVRLESILITYSANSEVLNCTIDGNGLNGIHCHPKRWVEFGNLQ